MYSTYSDYAMDLLSDQVGPDDTQTSDPLQSDALDKIRVHIDSRRERMLRQVNADEIKSSLVDTFRAKKLQQDGLNAKVESMRDLDPELYSYIRELEMVNTGIYCINCEEIKSVPGVNEEEKRELKYQKISGKCTAAADQLTSLSNRLSELNNSFYDELSLYDKEVERMSTQLAELKADLKAAAPE